LKLLYVEHGVYGYILVAFIVLYMAGSLRYRWIKHPLFNARSVQWRNTPYAHCTHFSLVIYACLQYNVVFNSSLKLLYIENRVPGCIFAAGRMLYIAVSLRYHRIKHPLFNAHSVQWRNTLLYVEHGEYGYILVARRVLYMAGSLGYRGMKHPWFNALSVQCRNTPYAHYTFWLQVECWQSRIAAISSDKIPMIQSAFCAM